MAFTQIRLALRTFAKSQSARVRQVRVRHIRPMLEWLEVRVTPAQILYVNQITDDGTGQAGTLSAAINTANNNPGTSYEIDFQNLRMPVISVTGKVGLPAIKVPLTINGYSLAGNNSVGGVPDVGLSGSNAVAAFDGLTINSGGVLIEGLSIDDFGGNGISLNDAGVAQGDGDTIQGCYIGVQLAGAAGAGNQLNGINITGSNNTIGGTTPGAGNVISSNSGNGIQIQPANQNAISDNVVEENTIGLNAKASAALPNSKDGVLIVNEANDNTIGGNNMDPTKPIGNIISGNGRNGVEIGNSAKGNEVLGNSIGVGSDGLTAFGNAVNGVLLETDANLTLIGMSSTAASRNIISGNVSDGVLVTSPLQQNFDTANEIDNNYIGVGSDGSTPVPNKNNGVEINSVVDTKVYGDVISGNSVNGVVLEGVTDPVNTDDSVLGCMIGTDATGKVAVANGSNGIYIYLANGNTIGAATQGTQQNPYAPSNVISGNKEYGVEIAGSSNLLVNNYIGTDVSGTVALGNVYGGVNVGWSQFLSVAQGTAATNNTIGGTSGVNSTLNVISGNTSQSGNQGDGISLGGSGVQNTLIEGNYVGVGVDGVTAVPNSGIGVYLASAYPTTNTTIGGTVANAGNVISANTGWGVLVHGSAGNANALEDNTIGFDVNGKNPNGNMKNKAGEVSPSNLGPNWKNMGNLIN